MVSAHQPCATTASASGIRRRDFLAMTALGLAATVPGLAVAAGAESQLTWGIHVSLSPSWFDPAETSGLITPFMVLYALQDALIKPMPDNALAPCLPFFEVLASASPRTLCLALSRRMALNVQVN